MNKNLARIGISVTILYSLLVVVVVVAKLGYGALPDLRLNEVGDSLAGGVGPIALLWLILGFFQQGIELKQNTKALKLQAAELANLVEQQAKTVALQESTLERENEMLNLARQESDSRMRAAEEEAARARRAADPNIVCIGSGSSGSGAKWDYSITLLNAGATVYDVNAKFDVEMRMHAGTSWDKWIRGERHQLRFAPKSGQIDRPINLTVFFMTERDERKRQVLLIEKAPIGSSEGPVMVQRLEA